LFHTDYFLTKIIGAAYSQYGMIFRPGHVICQCIMVSLLGEKRHLFYHGLPYAFAPSIARLMLPIIIGSDDGLRYDLTPNRELATQA